jgi:hypothetical protein
MSRAECGDRSGARMSRTDQGVRNVARKPRTGKGADINIKETARTGSGENASQNQTTVWRNLSARAEHWMQAPGQSGKERTQWKSGQCRAEKT